jgi:Xaa-Pro aminopeptidase
VLEQPLLVSDPANVRYLSGLSSSNAAVLVDHERVQVFTDYRYAESARAVESPTIPPPITAKSCTARVLLSHRPC